MTSFKSTARPHFCTPLDVRWLSDLLKIGLYPQTPDDERVVITDAEITSDILRKSGIVATALRKAVGGEGALYTTPYFAAPLVNFQNSRPSDPQAPKLTGVTVGASAVTELWTIRFTSDTTFAVRGSISGVQTATGVTTSNYTSDTDSDLVIPSGAWEIQDTGFDEGDVVYVPIYKVFETVVQITAYLTAGDIIDRLFSEGAEDESKHGDRLYRRGMKWIEQIQKGDMQLNDAASVPPVEFQEIRYDVTPLGDDLTDYPDSQDSVGNRRVKDSFDTGVY